MSQYPSASSARPRHGAAAMAFLIAVALLLPLCRPVSAATPHQKTARRRFADCQLLLTEKRMLGYDVSGVATKVAQARKTGLAGDLAGALELLEDAALELRGSRFPWSGPPDPIMVVGEALPTKGMKEASGPSITTGNLTLRFDDSGRVTGVTLDDRDLGTGIAGGFYLVDAATGRTGLVTGRMTSTKSEITFSGEDAALRVGIDATIRQLDGRLDIQGRLRDTSGADRALVLCFKVPVQGRGFRWWDDAELAVEIPPSASILQNSAPTFLSGSTGRLISTYPLACIDDGRGGLALGTAIDHPCAFRLAWDGRDQSLNLCYEFGLTLKTLKFPGEARFSMVLYPLEEPAWGFRSALDSYYRFFPAAFSGRAEPAGLWGSVDTAEALGDDFKEMGFAYVQGENDTPKWGTRLGLWSMRYCRPWSLFVPGPTTPEKGRLAALAAKPLQLNLKPSHRLIFGQVSPRDLVRAAELSVIHDQRGNPVAVPDRVYGGVNYVLNTDPEIVGATGVRNSALITLEEAISPAVRNRYRAGGQSRWGLFFDVAGTQLKYENFRQDHMAFADYPLVFDHDGKRPVILGLSSACEHLAHVREFAHREGGMVGVNTSPHPYNMVFLSPFCDMAGTEHLPGRREINNRLALARNKPIGFRSPESWERLMKYGLFYGVFPSRVPPGKVQANLERLRRAKPLLTRIVPLIRTAAAAGWEPVTRARTGDSGLLVERFGGFDKGGSVYFTVWNQTEAGQEVTLLLDETAQRWCGTSPRAAELAANLKVATTPGTVRFLLGADKVAMIRLEATVE